MKLSKIIFLPLLVLAAACSEKTGGDEPQQPVSRFEQKMVAMEFTSVHCTYCPILAATVKEVMNDRPGILIPVAFHLDFGGLTDPMALSVNKKFYDKVATGDGLPLFALNFRKSSQHIVNEYTKIVSEMDYQAKKWPSVCGVAVSSEYDESQSRINVTARFISDVEKGYNYHIFLVEDSVPGFQAGSDQDTYLHDCVFRAMAGDNIKGTKLDNGAPLKAGEEYKVTKSMAVNKDWNVANMKVVATILAAEGDAYCSNNAAVAPVGESADYSYIK